ncbi:MAG: hypothetical protein LQ350_000343 [Teloschistes chrysophthalmus]|nr:MAG: hypothetical protein LQ350_000343 [Niorma chrysophthalma]
MAIARALKRKRVSPSDSVSKARGFEAAGHNGYLSQASEWNLEQEYEQKSRKRKKERESTRLPIKTAEGRVERLASPVNEEQEKEDGSFGSSDGEASAVEEENQVEEKTVEVPIRQQIIEAKEELARIGTLLSEDPEEHIGGFKKLADIGASPNLTIKTLALATQLAIYKDVIPDYRIRPLGDTDGSEKLSKDVRKLRAFEQALVGNYQNYVKELAKCAKTSNETPSEAAASVATVAISCACTLLLAVPHFNFRGDLIKILVDKLAGKRIDGDFTKCLETLEQLFREDDDGDPSLDGVSQLTKMMKARDYRIEETVLNTFLHLRLLSELSSRGSQNRIDRSTSETTDGKKPKFKKEFRTKKQRKMLKERKVVEKEFQEADAIASHKERERLQSETLKLVFVTYFRILKARTPNLTGAVLEGLAKFAHLINQDFFGDLLEALKDIISSTSSTSSEPLSNTPTPTPTPSPSSNLDPETQDNPPNDAQKSSLRNSLLATTTAFALLSGQDIARSSATSLNLDLTFFTAHTYRSLHAYALNPDIELSSKSRLRLPDPHHNNLTSPTTSSNTTNRIINQKTPSVLLLRALAAILIPRPTPPLRVAAFAKQLHTCCLHLPEKSAQATIQLLHQVLKVHGRKIAGLWNTEERKGDGVFDGLRGDVEGSNPFAGTVWEGELLRCHYSPKVREGVRGVERLVGELNK